MKISKLIPILGIVPTVAIAPTLATSCGNGGFVAYTYDFSDLSTISDFVIEDRLETEEEITDDNITSIFLNEVNKNKKILADEFVYKYVNTPYEGDIDYTGVQYLVEVGNCDPVTGTMSFAIREMYIEEEDEMNFMTHTGEKYDSQRFYPVNPILPVGPGGMIVPIFPEGPGELISVREVVDIEVINLPFVVSYAGGSNYRLDPLIRYLNYGPIVFKQYMRSNKNWSITYTHRIDDLLLEEYQTVYNCDSIDEQMDDLYDYIMHGSILSLIEIEYLSDI